MEPQDVILLLLVKEDFTHLIQNVSVVYKEGIFFLILYFGYFDVFILFLLINISFHESSSSSGSSCTCNKGYYWNVTGTSIPGSPCLSCEGGALQAGHDAVYGSCSNVTPKDGEYTNKLCAPGNSTTAGNDIEVLPCLEPLNNTEIVTTVCLRGNRTTLRS